MPSTRLSVAVLTALAIPVATPSVAAVRPRPLPAAHPLVLADPAGDANGLNSQGGAVPLPGYTGQGGRPAADITRVVLSRTDNRYAVTGFRVRLTLAEAPDQMTSYQLRAATAGCTSIVVTLNAYAGGGTEGFVRDTCTGTARTTALTPVVAGAEITWLVPLRALGLRAGAVLSSLRTEARGLVGSSADRSTDAVVIDELRTDATWTIA